MNTTPIPADRITPRQAQFIEHYLLTHNAKQSAELAGYSTKAAKTIGCELVCRLEAIIASRRQALQQRLRKKVEVTKDRIVQEISCLAFFDPGKMFDKFGNPIDLPELKAMERRAVAGFDVFEEYEGKGESRKQIGYTRKYRMADKLPALMALCKVLGYMPKEDEAGGGMGGETINHTWNIRVIHVDQPMPVDPAKPTGVAGALAALSHQVGNGTVNGKE